MTGTEGPFSENSRSRSASPNKEPSAQREILRSLLGIDIPSWPFTEYSLVSAIALRTEQERSKQEALRLQTTQASFRLIQYAMEAGIPPHLIPSLILGNPPKSEVISNLENEPPEMHPPSRPPVIPHTMRPFVPHVPHAPRNTTLYGPSQYGSTEYGPAPRNPPSKHAKFESQPFVSQEPYRRNHRRVESDGIPYDLNPRYAGVRGSVYSAALVDEPKHSHQRTHSHQSPYFEGSDYVVGASPTLHSSTTTTRKGPGQHVIYPPPAESYRPPQGKQDVSFMISTPSNPPK